MTLEALSLAMAKDLRLKYYEFTTKYSVIFAKHLATETEVTLVNGKLADDNAFTLLQLELEFEICLENRISFQVLIRRTSGYTFWHIHTILQCSTVEIGVVVKWIVFENFTDQAEQSKHQTSQFVFTFTRLWINLN